MMDYKFCYANVNSNKKIKFSNNLYWASKLKCTFYLQCQIVSQVELFNTKGI